MAQCSITTARFPAPTAPSRQTRSRASTPAGGAVYNLGDAAAGTLGLLNTILANTPSGNTDCASTTNNGGTQTVTGGNSLIESNSSCGTPVSASDPALGALANNGGKTSTFAITTASPAYNTGTNTGCPSTDQRGYARPVGTCDIGAYEYGTPDLRMLKTASAAAVVTSSAITYTLTISNSGPHAAASAVVTDQLPSGVSFVAASTSLGSCTQASLLVTCNLGFLNTDALSGTRMVTISVNAPASTGTITNTGYVSVTTEATPADNKSSVSVVVTSRPVASAGPDASPTVNALVTLNGSASSDPDGNIPLSYLWQQTGGPAVTLSSVSVAQPTFTAPATPAVLTFTLVVTDALGFADLTPDSVVISVIDNAITGLTSASSSPTRLTDATFFTASLATGSNVVYNWNFGDGNFGSGATAIHTYAAIGSYSVLVTATNSAGSQSSALSAQVTNAAPLANAGADQTENVDALVTLAGGASSDPDGHTPLTYQWQQTSGSAVTLSSSNAAAPTFTAPGTPGTLVFVLTVTDTTGLVDATPDSVVITITDVALSALSALNDSPTVLGAATMLTASISAGSNVVYAWDFGDGDTGSGAVATHTYANTGVYTAIVTATNGAGSISASTQATITNDRPQADAGADQTVSVDSAVTLAGTGSNDPDGHLPLSMFWQQTSGPAVTLSSAAAAAPTFTAPSAPAVLVFTLAVTDARGLAALSTDVMTVTVIDIGIGGLSATSSSPTRLSDSTALTSTVANGSGVTYVWNFGDGSATQAGANATHTYTEAGSFTAVVTATNGQGAVTASTVVVVTNLAPVSDAAADQSVNVAAAVTLDGSASSDPDNHTPLSVRWQQTGGALVVLSDATATAPTFTAPSTAGVLTFTLLVSDAHGLADATPDEVVIAVTDIAVGGLSAINNSPTTLGDATTFTASITAGTNVTYTWDFGDGSPVATGAVITHEYALVGNYSATVTASNTASDMMTTTLAVITNLAPVADAGPDQTVAVASVVSLNGSASTDADGHLPLHYVWTQTGGPSATLDDANLSTPVFTSPAVSAVLTFTLAVSDARGLAAAVSDTVVITVVDIGISGLTAQNSGPTRLDDATLFTVTITAGSGVTYAWDFGDGSPLESGMAASHVYTAAGSYNAVVSATNAHGTVSASTVAAVVNAEPVPNAGADMSATVGSLVTLSGALSADPDGHLPLYYYWDQIGGASVVLSNPSALAPTFTAPITSGQLTFMLRVWDGHGLVSSTPDTVVVNVTQGPFSFHVHLPMVFDN